MMVANTGCILDKKNYLLISLLSIPLKEAVKGNSEYQYNLPQIPLGLNVAAW
jgi:hypothetical protein